MATTSSGCEINDSFIDLTDLDDIEQLEDLLKKKKKYKALIEIYFLKKNLK